MSGCLIKRFLPLAALACLTTPSLAQTLAPPVSWSGTYLGAFAVDS